MNFYRPKYFLIEELVDPAFIKVLGQRVWGYLDQNMLWTLDQLRIRFGTCIINGKYKGIQYTESGLRRQDTKTGAALSLHKFGRAFDLKFLNASANAVRADMESNYLLPCYQYITRCEADVSWIHIDNYGMYNDRIVFFKP